MIKERILFVEDEPDIQELVRHNLSNEGYSVDCTGSGENALSKLKEYKPDLVLLDLMLPGMDGINVCKNIKSNSRTHDMPIIMLTAKREENDILEGFKAGADDYMTKPFSVRELSCRIKSVLSKNKKAGSNRGGFFNYPYNMYRFSPII